jgi:2Fe-2S ferredoxin
MPQLIVITRTGEEHVIEAAPTMTVMEIIREAGVGDMLALCGGVCSCATCHIHVDPAFADALPPMGVDENDLLDASSHRDACSRLACQIRFAEGLSGLRVRIAEED